MALTDRIQDFVDMLSGLEGVEEVPALPLPNLPATRTAWAYPIPGDSAIQAHTGQTGGRVTQQTDAMIVEWHLKVTSDRVDLFLTDGPAMLDRLRNAIWLMSGQNLMVRSIRTTRFGTLGWGTDHSFGIRLSVEFIHFDEVSA